MRTMIPIGLAALSLCLIATATTADAPAAADQPAAPTADAPADIWLDVDTANGIGESDDGLAMIAAFHSPEVRVRGVSTVYGNASLRYTYPIALNITRAFGPRGMSVEPGAGSFHDLGKVTPAVRAMAEALKKRPMTILALGPVTNIGTLVEKFPSLRPRIKAIVMVAARRRVGQKFLSVPGQRRGFPDANFEHDPKAMAAILDTQIPLVFAPWEISSHVWITRDDIDHLRATGGSGLYIYATIQQWIDSWEHRLHARGGNPFDTLALGYVVHPQWMKGYRAAVRITEGPKDRPGGNTSPTPVPTPADTANKPYLIAPPLASAKPGEHRQALYLYKPSAKFKPWLLQRLAGRSR